MKNRSLAKDYLSRSGKRLKAVAVLMQEEAWADVVRESQEIVELSLKGLLRHCQLDVPRVHDVSEVILEERSRFPDLLKPHLDRMIDISRDLRRDRELAFYGSEDLTPESFYKKKDAKKAFDSARWVVEMIAPVVGS